MNRVIKDYPDLDRLSRSAKDCLKGVLKGQNLIDLGCGRCPDNFAKSLINLFGIAGYIGVDISTIPQKRSLKGRPFEIARVLPPAGSLVVMHFDLDRFANQAGLRLQKTFNDGYLRIYQKN